MTPQDDDFFTELGLPPPEETPEPPPPTTTQATTHRPPPPAQRGPFGRLMNGNFLQFASYAICDRAIPAVEDGLKPVQRRIMHALWERDDGRLTKVASVVGHAMQYHPHGDASISDAIVTLTNKRYLIEGQGNFGNIFTGDPAAANRYIECRLTPLAREQLFSPKITTYLPSYDGRNQEPVMLPAKIPLLLMLGVEGIAVGLSTSIMPHNFIELLEAQIAILQKQPFQIFPDFFTGGSVDVSEYDDGRGKVKVRAIIETREKEKSKLYITGLPWGTTTDKLIESIEKAIKLKKAAIRKIDDFTSEKIEIELHLSPGADQEKTKRALYAFTECERQVSSRIVVLNNSRPCEMTVSEILHRNTQLLLDTFKREFDVRLGEIADLLHRKTLERIFIEERIYKRIEPIREADRILPAVRDGFTPFTDRLLAPVTDDDIDRLLKIPIRRISLYDIEKHHEEMETLINERTEITDHLAHLNRYAVKYLKALVKHYQAAFPRRTEIKTFKEIEVRALTSTELTLRLDEDRYLGSELKTGETLFQCSSLDKVFILWSDGRYKILPPPDKILAGSDFHAAGLFDKETLYTCVYTEPLYGFTYIKRFSFGGAILNKEYRLIPEGGKILLFTQGTPETIYLKYKPMKSQRINQQAFTPGEVLIKSVSARGVQMTAKTVTKLETEKPRWFTENAPDCGKGSLM